MFGISTYCLHDEPLATALDRIAPLTHHIEVMDEGLHYLENADLLATHSCRYTIHAPSRGTNLASLLEPIRRASVEVMAGCFRIAGEVGAGVVLHPGYFAWENEREKAEQQLRLSLVELQEFAHEYSIEFFVENMGNWEYFLLKTPDELPLIDGCSFALDVGHAHQNRCLPSFLATSRARHFHLHDNDGTTDTHATVGDGTIDFGAVMRAVRASGVRPVIEVATFEGVKKSLDRLGAL